MSKEARISSRAIKSVRDELEAVGRYDQRERATGGAQLRRIPEHDRGEEVGHAMTTLEYLRRTNAVFDRHMRAYLFTEGDILRVEGRAEGK